MSESVHQDLPVSHDDDHIEFRTSEEQSRVIRKAAELMGWTVPQYVLSTVLDRAERDLYEYAAAREAMLDGPDRASTSPAGQEAAVIPLVAVVAALG
ncbi:type II toxin -antitoxin system TacA 1-like antitoxin [Actinomadura rudentiformis]|uniref:DUF1778 domain-containing protein n=1 Tax=Actinomadura rudentiformis TaxID=359158 RepID=A0A6H9YAU8_9ACTN|nr:DUF1778 domain-containing protein [Actinomadura rudentiformis]KAB2341852.1 DUF1778 domain-containing protein [Actinomadura rudentiformis]